MTRSADVQEVFSQNDVFQVTYGEKMMVIADGQNFFWNAEFAGILARRGSYGYSHSPHGHPDDDRALYRENCQLPGGRLRRTSRCRQPTSQGCACAADRLLRLSAFVRSGTHSVGKHDLAMPVC